MHRRKQFLIYPPNYSPDAKPFKRYIKRFSKFQAKKVAKKLGNGSEIDESIHLHKQIKTTWCSSTSGREWIHEIKGN